MRTRLSPAHPAAVVATAMILAFGLVSLGSAQSQEPKPALPATPVTGSDATGAETSPSGAAGASWEGPAWGVRLTWDPNDWAVENEFIQEGYDGLQIGTPRSTAFLEAYEGFGGDAAACLAAAEAEIGQRTGVSEVVPLEDRPLPVAEDQIGAARLFGVTATLADGRIYRGVEYVECRTLVPGSAVVEITWQALTSAYDDDFPLVQELFAAIELPAQVAPPGTPTPLIATPVA
jgi:hypothetical protein